MRETKKWVSKHIANVAKKATKYTVGKSFYPFGHEKESSEVIKSWVLKRR